MQRLGLGTAQWGSHYGIANRNGIATPATVSTILERAKGAGVSLLDTAWSYGIAERVVGDQGGLTADFLVVTKTRPLKGMQPSDGRPGEAVERAFRTSLSNLGRTSVYGLLVHHANDLLGPDGDAVWRRLQQLRAEGLVKKIGCSLYHPDQLAQLLERYELDIVQLPYNVYDQRYVTCGLADRAKARNVEVHVRSAFLQGVLLMSPDRLPHQFSDLRKHHAALWSECADMEVSPLQAMLGFCLACADIDKVVVGCERVEQWDEILEAAAVPLKPAACDRLRKFAVDDEAYVNPSRWKT